MANRLYFGDNLDVMRQLYDDGVHVDLIYLDPPFNSKRNYSVFFPSADGTGESSAQIDAFSDIWEWAQDTEALLRDVMAEYLNTEYARAANAIDSLVDILGKCAASSYLVNMGARLILMRRLLKSTGSIYLHCDPTMSHYLKILMDAVFGPEQFRNDIVWRRTSSHNSAKRWGPVHDDILFYTKSDDYTWNPQYTAYTDEHVRKSYVNHDGRGHFSSTDLTGAGIRGGDSGKAWRGVDPTAKGRHWAIPKKSREAAGVDASLPTLEALDALDRAGYVLWPKSGDTPRLKNYVENMPGAKIQDMCLDIHALSSQDAERLGYPTQKPVALLERIVAASSNEGDLALDPFCGCGTTIDAAQILGRSWIGIDVAYIAVSLIEERLRDTYGVDIASSYRIDGIPTDRSSAIRLWENSAYDFQCWVVSRLGGVPGPRGGGGVDGTIQISTDKDDSLIAISVKGGKSMQPAFVRDLQGVVNSDKRYGMGILVGRDKPTKGMLEEINKSGAFTQPYNGESFPKIVYVPLDDLLRNDIPHLPLPFKRAPRAKRRLSPAPATPSLFEGLR